jgi:hypothetical protein
MGGWAWGSLVIGLAIAALAVGIPFFLTHRRMREPHDVSDSRAYLRVRRRSVRQRRVSAASPPGATTSDHQGGPQRHPDSAL